jgi:aldose sugar dehydrogenase
VAVLIATFIGGAYFGRLASHFQLLPRARTAFPLQYDLLVRAKAAFLSAVEIGFSGRHRDKTVEWLENPTLLALLETSTVQVPGAVGWGGGIAPLEDGRLFYGARTGAFGVIGTDGIATALPFKVEMNLSALRGSPVSWRANFNPNWYRVTDIDLKPIGVGRYELLVGHHFFDPQQQCVELRLSKALLTATATTISLSETFRTVLTTVPCITFNGTESEYAFDGHFSGGRIARLSPDQVLFSTGDHGWVGLRGYPALSQDDSSTLGKVLLVNTTTGEVSTFAKGFRNPQGLTVDSKGRIWETEHGPRGGDELNLVVLGGNYGWPNATFGTDYRPLPWPLNEEQGRHGYGIPPQYAWAPSIGVSSLIESVGNEFPLWNGDLLVLSLAGNALHRVRLEGTRVIYDEPIFFNGSRLRDIAQFAGGRLALLTDAGTVIFVRNADRHRNTPFLDANRQQQRSRDMSAEERILAVAGPYAKGAPSIEGETLAHASEAPGATVFLKHCASCHSLSATSAGVGPTLKGVVGRRVGSANFAYSCVFPENLHVWSASRIVEFVTHPSEVCKGTSMKAVQLDPIESRDLEKYLDVAGR